jgi:hypothetical protein
MDLFAPIVPTDKFHPNFANCIAKPNPHDRAVIAKWADGFIDRDGKFVEEFQKSFNSCFWELYLHAVLKEAGCRIDFSHNAPDFVVTDPLPFVVEATVALNAKDTLPEWTPLDLKLRPRDLNEFNRSAMVRLLNSISEKNRKYEKSYRNLPHVMGKPFVLALTPFDQPFFYLEVQRAIEAVLYGYYVDEQEYLDDPSKFASVKGQAMKAVRKNSTVELPLGIFNDSSHAHISAVLFNSSATWGKVRALGEDPNPLMYFSAVRCNPTNGDIFVFRGPKADYHETLCDGLKVYHNPNANHRLDWRVFQEPGAFEAVCVNPETFQFEYWMDRLPPLAARNLLTLNVPEEEILKVLREEMAGKDRAAWQKLAFTEDLIREFAATQKGNNGDGDATPGAH